MEKRLFLCLITASLICVTLFAQDVPQNVISAFKNGNADDLTKYTGSKVELIMQSQQSNLNKQQVIVSMKNFFATHRVNDFLVNHQGKREGSSFMIGTLSTAQGKFRVNCFLRKESNAYLIHQIRIDKIND